MTVETDRQEIFVFRTFFPFTWTFFQEQFQVHKNIQQKVQMVLICPTSSTASLPTSPTKVGHLLQLRNLLHCHIITTQRPQFPFTPGAVHSMVLDKSIITYIHNYSIRESISTALKILCALCVHPSQPLVFLLSPQFYLFRNVTYSWNHTICNFFRLASFTKRYAFKIPACLSFHGLVSHFFLVLKNISLSHNLPVHLQKVILVTFKFWHLCYKHLYEHKL